MPSRIELEGSRGPWELALQLAGEPRCVAFIGEWTEGGALLADRPARVAGDGDPFSLVDGSGMWAGWWGYRAESGSFDLACYEHVVVLDPQRRWWVERTTENAAVDPAVVRRWQQRIESEPVTPPFQVGTPRPAPGRSRHIGAVEETVLAIAAGDFFQANVCMQVRADFAGSALGLWCTAGRRMQPPRAAFVGRPDGAVASMSPEAFLTRSGGRATTQPIKGTRPLTEEGRRELLAAAKDAAEHVMIVDLARNDLASVARTGSVEVPRLAEIRALAGVWHLESAVSAEVMTGDGELLRALFPPGSVTGAPKRAAVSWCSGVEESERVAYCGAIGFSSPVRGLQSSVAIRTVEIAGDRLWMGVGGGIVADSIPAQEWAECQAKAAPVLAAVGVPEWRDAIPAVRADRPVFETILLIDGIALELPAHAARISGSRGADAAGFTVAVRKYAAELGGGTYRLRVEDDLRMTATAIATPALVTGDIGSLSLRSYQVPGWNGAHKWSDRSILIEAETACGASEPLLLDGEEALETSRANIFALVEGTWRTPPLDDRVLPGITRRSVLDLILDDRTGPAAPGTPVPPELRIGPLRYSELLTAEAVIVTNAIRGIWWVEDLDGAATWNEPAPQVRRLAAALRRRWLESAR